MLSTHAIYEELKDAMGEKSAHVLAEVLSRVYDDLQQTVTRADFVDLKSSLDKLAQAQERTEVFVGKLAGRIDDLAQAQERTEMKVGELAQAQERTEMKVGELAQAQERTEIKVGELAGQVGELIRAQTRTEETLQQHGIILQRHGDQLGKLDGLTFEARVCREAASYFGAFMRKIRRVDINDLYDMTESVLTREEQADLARLDMVVRGRALDTNDEVYAAVEISVTIDDHDLDRAEWRAALMRKAGIKTVAVVVGSFAHPGMIERAGQNGIAMLIDRVQHHWQAALAMAQ